MTSYVMAARHDTGGLHLSGTVYTDYDEAREATKAQNIWAANHGHRVCWFIHEITLGKEIHTDATWPYTDSPIGLDQ